MKLRKNYFFVIMNSKQAKAYFFERCRFLFDQREAEEIFIRIMEHVSGNSKLAIQLDDNVRYNEIVFKQIVEEVILGKPIQYALGFEWFYNLQIGVNEQVLIPRPETEELVQWILETIRPFTSKNYSILDIGTGSACIALALKNNRHDAVITALDCSEDALAKAKENAKELDLVINFIEGDILDEAFTTHSSFDIIVSNPPYITISEKQEMEDRVLLNEPHLALFVSNNDALQFYKAILHFAIKHLRNDGFIFLELNRDYAIATQQYYELNGYQTMLKKDMHGNERMLCAQKKPSKN